MIPAKRWIQGAVLVAILAAAAMTFGCGGFLRTIVLVQVSGVVLHPPSDRDQFFNLVAVNFGEPALCTRIDWRADASSGGWDTPYQIRTLRSACRSYLERPPNTMGVVPDSMPIFAAQVRALGYTDANVIQAVYAETLEGVGTQPPLPEPAAHDYWEFVLRLIDHGPASDRAEFLRRVHGLE